jgi:hypothetical protein
VTDLLGGITAFLFAAPLNVLIVAAIRAGRLVALNVRVADSEMAVRRRACHGVYPLLTALPSRT